jgi:photosystem II stability/assembly factor-like uncharacterized protein
MKKKWVLILVVIFGALLFWKFAPLSKFNKNKTANGIQAYLINHEEEEMENEKEDGIFETQKQEFEMTKDPALGYIPKMRLQAAYETIMKRRKNQKISSVNSLSWVERGPYTDVTGPSNGNTRQGNGVTSGRMRAVWVDLSDATNHTVWAAGISGGLWKTTNISSSPATWVTINDFFANMAVSSICQDPSNKNIMYFGTGEKTYNADAVRGGGVWKSTDHGVSWNLLPNTANFYNVSKILCDATGNVYVATIGSGNSLMRSTDGGSSWTNIAPSGYSPRVPEMELSSTGRLHIVVGYYNTAVASAGYFFTDNPATVTNSSWVSPTIKFSNYQYNVDLAVAGNTLYALAANSSFQTPIIYKSLDGGDTWAPTATNPGSTISSGQGWYCLAIAVDPANDQNVVAGGLNMFRTTDGGTTWSQISNWVGSGLSYVHADQQYAVWNGNQVLVVSDGGMHYSNDGGSTFLDRNVGLRIKQFYSLAMHPTNYNYFLAGAQDNGVHQLNAPGMTGSVEVTGGDGAYTAIDQDEPQYQFGSYVFNQYRRSVNGGASWSSVNFSDSKGLFINPFEYDNAGNKIYASGDANTFLRWENPQTGSTFTSVALSQLGGGKVSSVTVSPFTSAKIYFGSTIGKVVEVNNADATTPSPVNITGSSMPAGNVSCVGVGTNDKNLIATFSNYGIPHVWVSTTGGGSSGWTNITGNLPDIPVRWALFYPEDNTKAILATEMGIFETNNINGSSTVWTQNATFPFVRTDMLKYRAIDGTIAAATHGRGLWTALIPKTVPYLRFDLPSMGSTEKTTTSEGCRNYTDYTLKLNIDIPPSGNATVNLLADIASTAKEGSDFDITTNGNFASPSKTLLFPSGSGSSKTFTVRIYDNAEVAENKSFIIKYTVTGATNAVAAPSSESLTYTIINDDVAPDPGGVNNTYTVGTYSYYLGTTSSGAPFNAKLSGQRTLTLYKASELIAAGISAGTINTIAYNIVKSSTRPYTNLQIKMGTTSVNNIVDGSTQTSNFSTIVVKSLASYSTLNGKNSFTLDNPFVWNGTDNLVVEICYDNQTASAIESADRTIGYKDGGTTTQGNMYWQDNIVCGSPFTNATYFTEGTKPQIMLTVANMVNPIASTGSNTIHIGGSGSNYFYSGTKVMASLSNASAVMGCTLASFHETGNVWQPFSGGTRSQKVFSIEPSQNLGSSYTIGLYYTTAELGGKDPSNLKIAKTNAASITNANSSNTVMAATSYVAFSNGYYFTAPFTGFSKYFLVDANVVLPITLLTFEGNLSGKNVDLTWKTTAERNSKYFEIEKSANSVAFTVIGKVNASGSSSTERSYSFTDKQPSEINFYRLKMVDADGKFEYSKTILIKNPNASQNLRIGNNPFHDKIIIHLDKLPQKQVKVELISLNGATIFKKEYGSANTIQIDLSNTKISAGMYLLKAYVDGVVYSNKVVKQ